MANRRDERGRFLTLPTDALSPAYRRRLERAEARGLSRAAARGHSPKVSPAWQSAEVANSPRYQMALKVLNRVRGGESLTRAARDLHMSPDTVLRYAGAGFTKDPRGRWQAKPSDRLVRRMKFLDAQGKRAVEPANFQEASKLSDYWNAVDHFAITGDDQPLRRFRRMRLRTRQKTSLRFITDLDELERLGRAHELSFEDIYQH